MCTTQHRFLRSFISHRCCNLLQLCCTIHFYPSALSTERTPAALRSPCAEEECRIEEIAVTLKAPHLALTPIKCILYGAELSADQEKGPHDHVRRLRCCAQIADVVRNGRG